MAGDVFGGVVMFGAESDFSAVVGAGFHGFVILRVGVLLSRKTPRRHAIALCGCAF